MQVLLEGENLDPDVDLGRVADATQGFSGSDLRQVCTAAAMRPVRELLAASGKSAQLAVSSLSKCMYLPPTLWSHHKASIVVRGDDEFQLGSAAPCPQRLSCKHAVPQC